MTLVPLTPLWRFLAPFAIGLLIGYRQGRSLSRADAPRQPKLSGVSGVPGPLNVLVGYMKRNQIPPPTVVRYAIAEAGMIGRHDLARDLHRTFVAPPRYIDVRPERVTERVVETDADMPDIAPQPNDDDDAQPDQPDRPDTTADVLDQPLTPPAPTAQPTPPVPPASMSSPLPGITSEAWDAYRGALERERPDFDSGRRVGRYALRKDRLRELGCDPELLIKHPRAHELQDAALEIETVDSAKHLAASGTLEAHLGRAIALPGEAEVRKVTLSGLLGVAQVAGLEGLVGWLEHPGDRKRFPHTTAMFARANGVF